MDSNNFYLFEIGGYLEENRYFELRKKQNGMMKLLKRINSNDELDESEKKKSKDFGYVPYKWYYLRVVIDGPSMKFFYNKIGNPEKMILETNDNEIPYGLIGLTTFNTKGVFDNLTLRPKIEEKRFSFSPSDIPAGVNPDEDVYLYNLVEKGRIIKFNFKLKKMMMTILGRIQIKTQHQKL